jgi:hypothetical protein
MLRTSLASCLFAFAPLLALVSVAGGCAAPTSSDEAAGEEDALTVSADAEWFYSGPLPALSNASVTVSLAGHTVRVTGYAPAGTTLPDLPHVKTRQEDGQLRLDVVYPIATARAGKSNSSPGTYAFYLAKPYRPDGLAVTIAEGEHQVPWGGFPFLAYNSGIAFHGPITSELSGTGDASTWYLHRGPVSGGCNRMQGENVVELAHMLGVNMRKLYAANSIVTPKNRPVTVVADYDQLDGKYIDVDYPTDTGVVRPAKVYGDDKVVMFGSWVASSTPNGHDLPQSLKWQGGVRGAWYRFADHVLPNMVCSVPKADLPALRTFATQNGGVLPQSFCARKECVLDALHAHQDAKATCGL